MIMISDVTLENLIQELYKAYPVQNSITPIEKKEEGLFILGLIADRAEDIEHPLSKIFRWMAMNQRRPFYDPDGSGTFNWQTLIKTHFPSVLKKEELSFDFKYDVTFKTFIEAVEFLQENLKDV